MFLTRKIYDLTFIGLGASNSLIIISLYNSGLLKNCTIAVIDPDPKIKNDKTYCFWASQEELDSLQLTNLIDRSWNKLNCIQNEPIEIAPLKYYHISSITLYDHVKHLLSLCEVDYYREYVTEIQNQEDDNFIVISTSSTKIQSIKIFDSRPPQWIEGKKHQSLLWQSFLGWKIKTTAPVFDSNMFTMMDFEVDQSDATQFIYILPYADNHALVELTRFGVQTIDHDYARLQLQKYCSEKKWNFTLLEEEKGMIPMSSRDIKQRSVNINHVQTGSAAGKVKPTTGYAFKEMAKEAIQIAENLSNNFFFSQQLNNFSRKGKFSFYDRLLLKILENNPKKGKLIFTSLFKNVDSRLVLKFLEEKTGLKEDIEVMMSLPKRLFIKQALLDCLIRMQQFLSYLFPIITTFLFLFLHFTGLDSIGLVLLSIGLITLGIPHGAMDHILDKKSSEKLSRFVGVYMLTGASMFLLWKFSPSLGLLFFVTYSAWHFGEADFIQWKLRSGSSSFLWGVGMILFLLFSHGEETCYILSQIINDESVIGTCRSLSVKGAVFSFLLMCFSMIQKRNIWLTISFMTIVLLSFIPLLQAFGIYFICQHSFNGWSQIKKRLQKTNSELWKHSLPFTLGAVILFFIFFTNPNIFWKNQIGPFFIFLSCISFPHVLNMHQFYRR